VWLLTVSVPSAKQANDRTHWVWEPICYVFWVKRNVLGGQRKTSDAMQCNSQLCAMGFADRKMERIKSK